MVSFLSCLAVGSDFPDARRLDVLHLYIWGKDDQYKLFYLFTLLYSKIPS